MYEIKVLNFHDFFESQIIIEGLIWSFRLGGKSSPTSNLKKYISFESKKLSLNKANIIIGGLIIVLKFEDVPEWIQGFNTGNNIQKINTKKIKVIYKHQEYEVLDKNSDENLNDNLDDFKEDYDIRDIDPFDFNLYSNEYDLISKYYDKSEAMIRTASLILYKYIWLNSDDERKLLNNELEMKGEALIQDITESFWTEQMLFYWYKRFNKEKVNHKTIISISNRYNCKEDELWKRLYKKYVENADK